MKKQVLFIMMILVSAVVSAQEIKWMSMNEALEAQKENPKKIFMDVYTDWCGPCKVLDRKTFQDERVVKYVNEHYYAVKFNAEGTEKITYKDFTYTNPNYKEGKRGRNSQHLFANALKVRAYPTMLFFDEEAEKLPAITGYHTPEQLEIYLKMIASDDYKELTTQKAWKEYQENFEGTF